MPNKKVEVPTRISSLRVQNVLAIEHVELKPKAKGVTIIAGANGHGKSSLLRAVELVLEYRVAARKVAEPLRRGAEKGWTELDLENGVQVRRTFTDKGTTLTVKNEGMIAQSPQSFVDAIRPPDLLDPLAFSTMAAADRRRLMIQIAGLGGELHEAETAIASCEEERRVAGRESHRLKAAFEQLPKAIDGAPDKLVSVVELYEELERVRAARRQYLAAEEDVERQNEHVKAAKGEVARCASNLKQAREVAAVYRKRATAAKSMLADLVDPTDGDVTRLLELLGAADHTNDEVRTRERKDAAAINADGAREAHEIAEEKVVELRERRDSMVHGAALPLEGLGFDEEDATFDGVRWSDIGTALQLRVGLALGRAQHPRLPVFVMHRGESLDAESLKAVDKWAAENGVQVLMEVVGGEGHEGAFVLESGNLKAAD